MKKLWLLLPALLMAGLVFMGCDTPEDNDTSGDVTWTVSADGVGASGVGVTTTTRIIVRFNQNVPTLRAQDIELEGPIQRGETTNSGSTFTILVTPSGSGYVTVTVNKSGVVPGPKTVEVWVQGQKQLISFTAVADGASNTITSTKITITFTAPVAALDEDDIEIGYPSTGAGEIIKGELTRIGTDNLAYDLGITVLIQGKIQISIPEAIGVDPSPRTIDVWKDANSDIVPEVDIGEPDTDDPGYKKWDISAEDLAAIKAAADGSKLRLYITVPAPRGGWGIGAIGVADGGTVELKVPADQTGLNVYIDVWVAWILEKLEDGDTLSIQLWTNNQGAELTGIELREPEVPFIPPEPPKPPTKPEQVPMNFFTFVQEIITTSGSAADPAAGKGNIEGDDMTAIKEAKSGSVLRFYMKNISNPWESRNGWGVAQFNNVAKSGTAEYDTTNHLFLIDVPVSELGITDSTTYMFINPYSDCIVVLCELWEPEEGVTPPVRVIQIPKNEHGEDYQGLLEGLFGNRKILEGDEYTLTFTFTSDTDISELKLFLLDNSSGAPNNSWWAELSEKESITGITAGVEKSATVVLTANATSSGTSSAANKLAFVADGTATMTLNCWTWSFTRTKDGEGEVVEPPEPGANDKVGFTLVGEISTTGGSTADPETGKGNIEGDDWAKVQAAGPWSVLRFYYNEGHGANYGCGQIGDVQLLGLPEYYDVWVGDLGDISELTYIFVNIWGDAKIIKCELWSPPAGTVYTKTEDLAITNPDTDTGKGNIEGADFTKLDGAAPGSFLRFIWEGTNGSAGGIGNTVGGVEFIDNTNKYMDIDVAVIKAAIGTNNYFFVNFWNSKLTTVELWEPSIDDEG
jgi:hypothetical protein